MKNLELKTRDLINDHRPDFQLYDDLSSKTRDRMAQDAAEIDVKNSIDVLNELKSKIHKIEFNAKAIGVTPPFIINEIDEKISDLSEILVNIQQIKL